MSTLRSAVLGSALAVLVSASAGACSPPPDDGPTGGATPPGAAGATAQDHAPDAVQRAFALQNEIQPELLQAFQHLRVNDWEGCIEPFESVARKLEAEPLLGGLRDQCLYNAACAYSRTGQPALAVERFAESVENGLRVLVRPISPRDVVLNRGLSIPHILVDADLDALRERADFQAVIDRLTRGGATARVAPATDGAKPALVVLLGTRSRTESAIDGWTARGAERDAVVYLVEGPLQVQPGRPSWLPADGDDRFATAKISEVLMTVAEDDSVDAGRVHLVAMDDAASEAAIAAVFAEGNDVRGLSVTGGRFHAAWHADAIDRVAKEREAGDPLRVVVPTAIADHRRMLHRDGLALLEFGEGLDEALDALLGSGP